MTPLLELDGLRTWFPIRRGIFSHTVGHVQAVDGVSLKLEKGKTLGLVGESGCGKTTLARTILRLDPAREGRILFKGDDVLQLSGEALRQLRRNLQIVFQDPFASLNPRMTVMDLVTEGMVTHGLIPAARKEEEAARLLQEVGLGKRALYRYPHEFSGGQRQRISVARAISLRPEVVICDEAVSALDVSVQAQVLNLLMDLRERHGLSYLFISHDLSVVRHIADDVAVMYLGRIVEHGPAQQVMDHPQHPYTRALVSAIPKPRSEGRQRIVLEGDVPSPANPPSGCRFHPRCPYATDRCAQDDPVLQEMEQGGDIACLRYGEI